MPTAVGNRWGSLAASAEMPPRMMLLPSGSRGPRRVAQNQAVQHVRHVLPGGVDLPGPRIPEDDQLRWHCCGCVVGVAALSVVGNGCWHGRPWEPRQAVGSAVRPSELLVQRHDPEECLSISSRTGLPLHVCKWRVEEAVPEDGALREAVELRQHVGGCRRDGKDVLDVVDGQWRQRCCRRQPESGTSGALNAGEISGVAVRSNVAMSHVWHGTQSWLHCVAGEERPGRVLVGPPDVCTAAAAVDADGEHEESYTDAKPL
eukprot:365426-Chlamydomonas_euryale.AAC.1